tara:strand:- start:31619 stop:33541 length:1923 start_codon:yes stop_codon:yes gene_type:complete
VPKIQIMSFNRTDEAIESCDIQPTLPDGLNLNSDCSISGKATQARSQASYVITGRTKKYVLQANLLLEITLNGIAPKYDRATMFFIGSPVDEVIVQKNESDLSQCKISPKLPAGLNLSDSCRMSGVAVTGFDERIFEVKYVYAGKNQVEKLQVKVIDPKRDSVLMMVDARKALGNGPLTDPCQNDLINLLSDLSEKNSFLKYTISDSQNACATWSSPAGTINDPYRLYGFGSTTATLSMPNSISLNFSQDPYSIISFFRISDTSFFNIEYGFNSAVPSCLNGKLRIETERSVVDGVPDKFKIKKSLCNNSYETVSFPGSFNTDGWHQMAQVVVPAENKTDIYLDGQFLNSTTTIPVYSNILSSRFSIRLSAGELGSISIYRSKFLASEIFQQCEYFKNVYSDLNCSDTHYNLRINKFDIATVNQDHCLPVRWNIEDNKGSVVTIFPSDSKQLNGQGQLFFNFASTIGSFYSDPSCTLGSALTGMQVATPDTQGTVYFKSNFGYRQIATINTVSTQNLHIKNTQIRVENFPIPDSIFFQANEDCTKTYVYFNLMSKKPNNTPVDTTTKFDVIVQLTDGVQTFQTVTRGGGTLGLSLPSGLGLNKQYTFSVVSPANLAAAINPVLSNGGVITTPQTYSGCGN